MDAAHARSCSTALVRACGWVAGSQCAQRPPDSMGGHARRRQVASPDERALPRYVNTVRGINRADLGAAQADAHAWTRHTHGAAARHLCVRAGGWRAGSAHNGRTTAWAGTRHDKSHRRTNGRYHGT